MIDVEAERKRKTKKKSWVAVRVMDSERLIGRGSDKL